MVHPSATFGRSCGREGDLLQQSCHCSEFLSLQVPASPGATNLGSSASKVILKTVASLTPQ